jgi:hypothetical protein
MDMDDLDRIFRRLIQQLRARYPQYLSRPFEAEEIYQVIVPYRHHRQELGIDTNQDYEAAVMRLLSGERSYLTVDREMRDALTRELESSNPDTSLFRVYGSHRVSVSAEALGQLVESGVVRTDDARVAAVGGPDTRRARTDRSGGPVDDGLDGSDGNRSRPNGFAASGAAAGASGAVRTPGGTPRFDGMPLPPSSLGRGRSGIDEAIPPAPPRSVSAERLAPSPAPTTSPPSGRASGLTGHGSRVAGGLGTPPAFADGNGGVDGSAKSSRSIPSRREHSGAVGGQAAAGSSRPAVPHSADPTMVSPRRSVTADTIGGQCRYCTGALPEGRQITFCPHCGQDLTVQQCPACSTELELGWKFCTTCGRSVGQS